MRLKSDSSEQQLRGAFYTPLLLAETMVRLSADGCRNVLEPSCGDGVFLEALVNSGNTSQMHVDAVEINREEADKAREKTSSYRDINVTSGDFFDFCKGREGTYDLIIGNPPYIRYQYLEENQREQMSGILESNGMKANRLVNAWVGFMVSCINMLSENGRIAFVVPAEILQIAYAEELRLFLAKNLSSITLITFEKLIFPCIEQEVVVFIGEKGRDEKGIRIIELNNMEDLKALDINSYKFQKLQQVHEKWTKYFTDTDENALVQQVRADSRFQMLSDIALVNVGITTGNNRYFSVNLETVEKYQLQDVVRPLVGRSSHADSIYFRHEDWQKNVENGRAAFLIDFPDTAYDIYPEKHKEYIEMGERNGENRGYKCSIRERWYRIPSVWVPDAFFLRRSSLYPKFVLNQCGAVSTDTMHRIQFHEEIDKERAVLSYYNSVSFAFTELCGRSYGGGVLEILPGEAGNIYVPKMDTVPAGKARELLRQIDSMVRDGQDIERVLDIVDREVLVDSLGIDTEVCRKARHIWKKLQGRRLNRGR